MSPLTALLISTLAAAPGRPPASALEILPIPAAPGGVTLAVDPLERSVVLESRAAAPAIAKALRATSRLLCPEVTERDAAVALGCRSTRVVARLVGRGATLALELEELPGLPGQGATAMPILFHDPLALGLGSCPGQNAAARGECRLRAGQLDGARVEFLTASRSAVRAERDHALLRLGDLALASGDAVAAEQRWQAVETEPWARLARARQCELSVPCLVRGGDGTFSQDGLPISMAREMRLRSARVRAFRGEPAQAAWQLADEFTPAGACAGDAVLCRRIVLAALRSPDDAAAAEALALYAAVVKPGAGDDVAELARAAADVAERQGAPAYAAALLSSTSASLPARRVQGHLLRTAELYVAAGDAVRARVVVDFVRGRGGAGALSGARWAAVQRGIAALRSRPAAPQAANGAAEGAAPELVASARALERARAARGLSRAQP